MHTVATLLSSLNKTSLRLLGLSFLVLLSACRMPVAIQGQGFVFGEQANTVYRDGYVFEINEDFQETFWPVPAPGHSFSAWNEICSVGQVLECSLTLTEDAWGRDDEIPLDATFTAGYQGPMVLNDYQFFWDAGTRTLTIPAASIVLEGSDPAAPMRTFVAPPGMPMIIPGTRVGPNYEFTLPTADYIPDDYWLMISTLDEAGTLATVSYDFGIAESLNPIAELKPYSQSSPWKDVLVNCAAASNPHSVCSMQTLPYIGAVTSNPSVSDIMQRVVVSHGWMGNRYSQVLQNLPPEMLKMFRGVTAIVIGSDIRPAFFTALTGAIYIDPQDLWLTPRERESIDWTPDFRSDFGNALQFIPAGTYLSGRNLAWGFSGDYPEGVTRSLVEIILPLGYVIAHELAHANDFIHPAIMPPANSTLTPLDFYFRLWGLEASAGLGNTYPLSSQLLYQVADVLYRGVEANNTILNLTAADVGQAFASDTANSMYSYSTIYEDTATLVEEVLMSYFFGVDKLQSFLDEPAQEPQDCTDYILQWGSLNRASVPQIKERARLVLSTILDEADVSKYLNAVPAQRTLQPGLSLCENLDALFSVAPQSVNGQAKATRTLPRLHALQPAHEHKHPVMRKVDERREKQTTRGLR
ncbi:hypothetical protein BST95_03145 [Halioglobus japonicus]|uniref:Uncharacterized protein n=1 Tax=Halioglobus japonicus TaxID=930805 RepID=A0AAP8MCJ2_9GAMM|nr:hypothetical protein [Halioglobus japonicus]AQA17377.1 hypothetical protein BST95_03145 [Halioglobus japonicus]PLW85300.1 hypothetical protein C0029_11715 [Halioglobus japonicus]GHD22469.1 hypothetical protein GCM10007052_34200 [Halioglobus japonicus]